MKYFLLLYNHLSRIAELKEYLVQADAIEALREAQIALGPREEALLLIAETEDALKATHSSYFIGSGSLFSLPDPVVPPPFMSLDSLEERIEEETAKLEANLREVSGILAPS